MSEHDRNAICDLAPPEPISQAEAAVVTRVLAEIRANKGGRLTLHLKPGKGAEAVTWERTHTGRVADEISP